MISWHRVGQKVMPVDQRPWRYTYPSLLKRILGRRSAIGPSGEMICTISEVLADYDGVWFALAGWNDRSIFSASCFRPVYPEIIDQLRNLDTPVPSEPGKPVRVKEGVMTDARFAKFVEVIFALVIWTWFVTCI